MTKEELKDCITAEIMEFHKERPLSALDKFKLMPVSKGELKPVDSSTVQMTSACVGEPKGAAAPGIKQEPEQVAVTKVTTASPEVLIDAIPTPNDVEMLSAQKQAQTKVRNYTIFSAFLFTY